MGVVKLYGSPISTCTTRVLLCLEEVGAEYELVPINMMAGEHKGPAHLARNVSRLISSPVINLSTKYHKFGVF
jgi:glutathione S-transferase